MKFNHAVRAITEAKSRTAYLATVVLALLVSDVAVEAANSVDSAGATGASTPLPAPPASGEMGYVFSLFVPAVYPGMKDNCPNGASNMVRENFLASLPSEERERLLKPENEPELTTRWKAYGVPGPGRRNLCSNFDEFPDHPLYKTVQGKISYGLKLDNSDGKSDPYVCPHEKFTSPTGEKGVDNQMYRALGCQREWRGADGKIGDVLPGYKGLLATGEYTFVMILRNVHSLVKDDDVEVVLASTADKPIVDTQQNFIYKASYHVIANPSFRTVLHGHIVNGVLTTDSKDVQLYRPVTQGSGKKMAELFVWDFARSRLQFTFKPDGSLEGVMGGYAPLTLFMPNEIGGGAGTVTVADIDCASQFNTVKKLADGERDPRTGQCSRISTAFLMAAVPAFVMDQSAATRTAVAR
jgi:hypothetical protein